MNIYYDRVKVAQRKSFKYLGFHLDVKLPFRTVINAPFIQLRKAYVILKCIHQQFSSFSELKAKFFNAYIWPHLYMMATIYCFLLKTSRERLASFYQRFLRPIHYPFQRCTENLHHHFHLRTIEQRYEKCLLKRMKNIQLYESVFIESVSQHKYLFTKL